MGKTPHGLPLTLQQLAGAAERLSSRSRSEKVNWLEEVERARDRLLMKPFQALPLSGFFQTKDGKERLLSKPAPADRIIQEALLPILNKTYEAEAADSTHGFRKGRSTFTAASALREILRKGGHILRFLDIRSFFPSVDRDILETLLDRLFPKTMVDVVMALLSAPVKAGPGPPFVTSGLPLGCPLSPVLSNLYLSDMDRRMKDVPTDYLRYADDILLGTSEDEAIHEAQAALESELEIRNLQLNEEKSRTVFFLNNPVFYLGHLVDSEKIYQPIQEQRLERLIRPVLREDKPESDPVGDPTGRARTLYITEGGVYLKTGGGQLICQRGKEVLREIPLHRINRILVLAGGSYSSGLLSECIKRRIPILFFVGKGKGYGSLVSEGLVNPLRLRAQYDLRSDPKRRFEVAKDILSAKFQAMILRLSKANVELKRRKAIEGCIKGLEKASGIDTMMGLEGQATSTYYRGFAQRIRQPEFAFIKRSKRPPRDAINSLLSFTYSLIFGEMQTALLAHGLDPHPGFLHELHRNHPALASDLLEPYRSLIADTFVLTLVNRGSVHASGFEKKPFGAVYMNGDTRNTVLRAYERFMSSPMGGKSASRSPRLLMHGAVRAMLGMVLGESDRLVLPLKADDLGRDWEAAERIGDQGPVPVETLVKDLEATNKDRENNEVDHGEK